MKETVISELELNNRFDCLQDRQITNFSDIDQDKNIFDNMFTVGPRNIFNLRRRRILLKLRKTNVSKDFEVDPSFNIDERSFKKRKANRLNCFETWNVLKFFVTIQKTILKN